MNIVRDTVYIGNVKIEVDNKIVFKQDDMQKQTREAHVYDFAHQLLLEHTNSNWDYDRSYDSCARGIFRTFNFNTPQGDNAQVEVFFIPHHSSAR